MTIQSASTLSSTIGVSRSSLSRQNQATSSASFADTIASVAAYADKSVGTRLASIKAKAAVSRTQEEQNFLLENDKKLAEIIAQGRSPNKLTAEELDYMQKAGGFVNTMANLSASEKALYDKAIASGNDSAAAGISQIAFIRMMGHTAGGDNGSTYDPIKTEITAANIGKYFKYSIIDPSGKANFQFQALIQYLKESSTV